MERILIIEDEPDIQELLRNYLEEEGYETEQALDGIEGIGKFRKRKFDSSGRYASKSGRLRSAGNDTSGIRDSGNYAYRS
ncbi:Uncharacterised protein [uncultured Blautia sp.]